jgi:hypothetical protein
MTGVLRIQLILEPFIPHVLYNTEFFPCCPLCDQLRNSAPLQERRWCAGNESFSSQGFSPKFQHESLCPGPVRKPTVLLGLVKHRVGSVPCRSCVMHAPDVPLGLPSCLNNGGVGLIDSRITPSQGLQRHAHCEWLLRANLYVLLDLSTLGQKRGAVPAPMSWTLSD